MSTWVPDAQLCRGLGLPRGLVVRHLWWRHAVRERRLQRRSAGTSSEAREERQERAGMHIEAQRRDGCDSVEKATTPSSEELRQISPD